MWSGSSAIQNFGFPRHVRDEGLHGAAVIEGGDVETGHNGMTEFFQIAKFPSDKTGDALRDLAGSPFRHLAQFRNSVPAPLCVSASLR